LRDFPFVTSNSCRVSCSYRYTYVVLESFTVTETEGQADSYHSAESGGSMTIARCVSAVGCWPK